jgi:hypothetical protein
MFRKLRKEALGFWGTHNVIPFPLFQLLADKLCKRSLPLWREFTGKFACLPQCRCYHLLLASCVHDPFLPYIPYVRLLLGYHKLLLSATLASRLWRGGA